MNAVLPEKIDYAAHWTLNAEHFERQSCYTWMADLLKPISPKKILDIGCGVGHGLLALAQQFEPQIIAVDENGPCLSEAQALLAEHGYASDLVLRMGYQTRGGGSHVITTDQSPIVAGKKISLIHGDVLLGDPELRRFIEQAAPYDAITVWLIGTDPDRFMKCENLASLKGTLNIVT